MDTRITGADTATTCVAGADKVGKAFGKRPDVKRLLACARSQTKFKKQFLNAIGALNSEPPSRVNTDDKTGNQLKMVNYVFEDDLENVNVETGVTQLYKRVVPIDVKDLEFEQFLDDEEFFQKACDWLQNKMTSPTPRFGTQECKQAAFMLL